MLHIDHNAEHHILIRLSQAMALFERIIQVRENNFSSLRGKSRHWEDLSTTGKKWVFRNLGGKILMKLFS
ncbi:hypothetical protein EOY42_24895 [Salmonella enterica]|nr:hypothetical protein [Salmonella enterica]